MLLVIHAYVLLWRAARAVCPEESTIASVKDVHLRIVEFGVLVVVDTPIAMTNMFGPVVEV